MNSQIENDDKSQRRHRLTITAEVLFISQKNSQAVDSSSTSPRLSLVEGEYIYIYIYHSRTIYNTSTGGCDACKTDMVAN
jgi:hypothetical protein